MWVYSRLYMPYGVLHRAVTGEGGSSHLTFEFTKRGVTWFELILAVAGYVKDSSKFNEWALAVESYSPEMPGVLAVSAPCCPPPTHTHTHVHARMHTLEKVQESQRAHSVG